MATKTQPRGSVKTKTPPKRPAKTPTRTATSAARTTSAPATKTVKKHPPSRTPPPPRSRPSAASRAKAPPPRPKTPPLAAASKDELPRTPPASAEEFVLHIRLIGKRLDEHVGFMCTAEKLMGTSAEARGKALTQFHARLALFEQELGRIREELQLG